MAVLLMPMVPARASGVLYTRDPARPDEERLLVDALRGRGADLVAGCADAETAVLSRAALDVVDGGTGPLSPDELATLGRLGLAAEALFGETLDVEWAVDDGGHAWLLQARPLVPVPAPTKEAAEPDAAPLARGGLTVVGGRTGGVVCPPDGEGPAAPETSPVILVAAQAAPELGFRLSDVDGLVAEHGSVTGHLAALAREAGVPSVFGMPEAACLRETPSPSTPPGARSSPGRRGRWRDARRGGEPGGSDRPPAAPCTASFSTSP
jgi:pyruvate,water dikinase